MAIAVKQHTVDRIEPWQRALQAYVVRGLRQLCFNYRFVKLIIVLINCSKSVWREYP